MPVVAVVAHERKSLGGGLAELRQVLAEAGHADPIWHAVPRSREAPKKAREALEQGAELVFVWGGDGTVQRCADVLAGTGAAMAIIPAGTANLLAANLGLPADIRAAVRAGLDGCRRPIDTGSANGERFAVMAGAGFDARMIKEADGKLKDRFGRAAYVYAAARSMTARPVHAVVKVDGSRFFTGRISCVLAGNVGTIVGGMELFPFAMPDDGLLEFGVVTARNPVHWARTLGRMAFGSAAKSPFVRVTRGSRLTVRFDRPVRYQLDGGARKQVTKLRIKVRPSSLRVCVPADAGRSTR